MTRHLKLLFLLLLLLVAACAPPPAAPPGPAPSAELLLQKVGALAGAYESLRGVARVRVESGKQSFSATQVLLAQKPRMLRSETLSPFGNPVLTVAVDGEQLRVMVPGEGRFLAGEASYSNLQRFTRLPLQLEDLVDLLLYQVPLIPWEESRVAAGEDRGWLLTLTAAEAAVRQELLFDRDLRLIRASYFQGDDLVLTAGYGEFGPENGFPRSMVMETPGQQTEASLSFSDVEVNVPLPGERFRLDPPAGYTLEPLP